MNPPDEENVPFETAEDNPQTTTALAPPARESKPLRPEEVPDLDSMEEGMSLQVNYLEFETEGERIRAVLVGWQEMTSQNTGQLIPVAILQNKDGIFANAGANLTKQLQNVPLRTPVQVTYLGKEKTKSGNHVKLFDVKMLSGGGNAPKQDVASIPVKKAATVQTTPPARPVQRSQPVAAVVKPEPGSDDGMGWIDPTTCMVKMTPDQYQSGTSKKGDYYGLWLPAGNGSADEKGAYTLDKEIGKLLLSASSNKHVVEAKVVFNAPTSNYKLVALTVIEPVLETDLDSTRIPF